MNKLQLAIDIFNKYAHAYSEKFMDVVLYSDTLNLLCEKLQKKKATILELGCGPGNLTRYLLEKRSDFSILATDLSENMLLLAKTNAPAAQVKQMDCRNFLSLNKNFDAIVAGFCLPYLSREEAIQLIQDAGKALSPHGFLYVSTMEDDYDKSGFKTSRYGDQLHIYYHQADYLQSALKNNNFNILDLQRKVYPADDGSITTDLIILAQKQ